MPPLSENKAILEAFKDKKILVIGDCILDVYLNGTASRLAPEAPVPIVDVTAKSDLLGGAANTAANLAALGAEVMLCTVIGADEGGQKLIELCKTHQIDTGGVVFSRHRKTLVKTRLLAGDQLLTRFDVGSTNDPETDEERALVQYIKDNHGLVDAMVISDYVKGVLTPSVVDAIQYQNTLQRKWISIDSKRLSYFKRLTPDLVKPNLNEARVLLGERMENDLARPQVEAISHYGTHLFEKTGAQYTFLTLDASGAMAFNKNRLVGQQSAPSIDKSYVSGAGDTFISTATLSLMSGSTPDEALEAAIAAAFIAIGKPHTSLCTFDELTAYFSAKQKHIHTPAEAERLCVHYRAMNKKIVFTNGCFDILHPGHVTYLEKARRWGDVLIVGINNDDSITRLKGITRPINTLLDRASVLAGLQSVDHIIAFGSLGDDTPISLIEKIKPDFFVKGGDYSHKALPESATVEALGGKIVLIPTVPNCSTSGIISRMQTATA